MIKVTRQREADFGMTNAPMARNHAVQAGGSRSSDPIEHAPQKAGCFLVRRRSRDRGAADQDNRGRRNPKSATGARSSASSRTAIGASSQAYGPTSAIRDEPLLHSRIETPQQPCVHPGTCARLKVTTSSTTHCRGEHLSAHCTNWRRPGQSLNINGRQDAPVSRRRVSRAARAARLAAIRSLASTHFMAEIAPASRSTTRAIRVRVKEHLRKTAAAMEPGVRSRVRRAS